MEKGWHQVPNYLATTPHVVWAWGGLHVTIFSPVNPKLISITCCPLTGLLHLDPISGTLAGEKLFECKVARKINEGLINADVLLGSIDICKFLVNVICEGMNSVEPVKFRVSLRTTECIVVEMHKSTLYSHIYAWPWQQRTREYDESDLGTNTTAIHFF
ncbi:unnamed protein product [Staurois parvus]|uniref:Uncharacterized protein n=1 Tax=Staurois parvus TaxID=386267 RepID=A0ABN9HNM8_9NEOB|nr:unnamed protein product [Staurois parvus]